jgi:RNA 3'-terminal phosphate cyclase (ATP)
MVTIDGSFGEGGGQMIRTSLSLSALINIPFRIVNVRRNRPKPGLRAQHLAAVRAMKEISHAEVDGDFINSTELVFKPRQISGGAYAFDIRTAGATSLVLQTLIPPLIFAGTESRIVLSGGTHVPISPPFHFIQKTFLPLLAEFGVRVHASIDAYGFYPRGGGRIEADILPILHKPLHVPPFPEEKTIWAVQGVSAVANLPLSIAERQKAAAMEVLGKIDIPVHIDTASVHSPGTGTFIFLGAQGIPCRAGFSSIGIRGKRAEAVGAEAASTFMDYYRRDGCIDPHLADQIVLYMALADGESSFTTMEVSDHLRTNLHVIQLFTGARYSVEETAGAPGKVTVRGIGFK